MKATININKLDTISTDLLESAFDRILLELMQRTWQVSESCLGRKIYDGSEKYKSRYETFRKIVELNDSIPGRLEYLE